MRELGHTYTPEERRRLRRAGRERVPTEDERKMLHPAERAALPPWAQRALAEIRKLEER